MIESVVVWPVVFGLLGFVEPCALGTTFLFLMTLEGRSAAQKTQQVLVFALTRTVAMGILGAAAALVGSWLLGLQKAVWIAVGLLYVALGALYMTGRIDWLKRSLGPGMARLSASKGAAALGMLFGLNIPACAGPLLIALLAASAAEGASAGTMARGFVMLSLFGLALSAPIIAAAAIPRARRVLDGLAGLGSRIPLWSGFVLVALGAWSIWFGLFVTVA